MGSEQNVPPLCFNGESGTYNHQAQLLKAVTEAPSAPAGAEALYQILHDSFALTALCVELTDETMVRFYPYGDLQLAALPKQTLEVMGKHVVVCSFSKASEITGFVSWIFPEEKPTSQLLVEILDAASALLGYRFALERTTQRLEEAEESLRVRLNEMAAIYEIGQATDPKDIPRLLQTVVERTARMMDAQACSLMLMDEHKNCLRLVAAYGLPEGLIQKEQKLEEGLAGRVVLSGQPMLIVDSAQSPRPLGGIKNQDIGSSMLFPLKDQTHQVLGVLSVRRRRPAKDFNTEDLKLFSVFAAHTALALSSMRLHADLKARAAEMGKLSTLASALISTTDFQSLSTKLVEEICSVVGFPRCALYLQEDKKNAFVPISWHGYPDEVMRQPMPSHEGILQLVAERKGALVFDTRQTENLPDKAARLLRGFARALGSNLLVIAPIRNSHGECFAVLVADNRTRKKPILPTQLNLLNAFVGQAGIAIENARLYIAMRDSMETARKLQAYTERVLRSIDIAILSADSHGMITRCNPAVEKILGIPASKCRGCSLDQLVEKLSIPQREKEMFLRLVERARSSGEAMLRQRFPLHFSGPQPKTVALHVSGLPEPGNEPSGVVLIMEDITQEIALEREIERMRRLADIGQLAAKMAHEVRNALSPIRAGTQILQRELQSRGIASEWTEIILSEVDDLTRLTGELLEFSRPTTLHPQTLDLVSFLQTTLQTMRPMLDEQRITLRWNLQEPMPPLQADPVHLQQILRNLVSNAVQAMNEQGELEIAARYEAANLRFVIEVRDNGEGIAPEDKERIFQPFVTTRPKGTGLGLPIVVKLLEQHGGHIEVESQRGEGACFRIFLPPSPPVLFDTDLPLPTPRLGEQRWAGN